MSFILDALKKSENDRQRQSGPALFEVRVAPPRSRFPMWAVVVVGLLVINVSVIGWLMLRRPAAAASPQLQASAAPPASQSVQSAPVPAAAAQPVQTAPPPVAQTTVAPPAPVTQAPVEAPPLDAGVRSAEPPLTAAAPRSPSAEGNPDDYAPATEPAGDSPFGGHVRRGTESGLPTYEEAATRTEIPPLRMDLHVYAPDKAKRFVLVNMKRLYEGDSLPEGVKVDSITTDGAILSYRGSKFVLERE